MHLPCRLSVIALLASVVLAVPAHAQPWVDVQRARTLLRERKFADAADAYGAIARQNPYDGEAWGQYGYCLHSQKKYDEAIKAYSKAIELGTGRPTNLYNTACALSLLGRKDEALDRLRDALEARFADQETLENDTDMDPLRDDPRFAALTGITAKLKEKPAQNRDDGWKWDLEFYLRRMKQMHWNLYGKVSEARLRAEIDKLEGEAPTLTDGQVRARLRRITALVGDGHTSCRLYPEGAARRSLPIQMFVFKDGLYIIGADAAHEALLGAKVIAVGPLDAAGALTAIRAYASVDNEMGYLAQGPALLAAPLVLREIGATSDETGAEFTVVKGDGTTAKVRIDAVDFPAANHAGIFVKGFNYLHDRFTTPRPLYLRDIDQPLRLEVLPETKTVYFWFGAVQDPSGGTFKEFVERVFAAVEENKAENLVIDMRFNGGGNTGLVAPLLNGLVKNDRVNRKGHLFVIIGRNTFSAAQNTVNAIDQRTEAIFVGEPTGSRPEFVGESTYFVLPHSRTRVFCSSRYWQQMDSTDERTWVPPGVVADPTFAAYSANRDPAMEAITKLISTK